MTEPAPRPNPYVGPRAFQRGEKLYGRDVEVRDLLDLLIAQRIVLLHSPSGAGKSSLIQAGLLPCLEEENFQVLPIIRVNAEPPAGLESTPGFNRYLYSTLDSLQRDLPVEQRLPPDRLVHLTLDEYLSQVPLNGADGLVLIFDQFEEILTTATTDRAGKTAFFGSLGPALRHKRRWALFTMREDYVAALDPFYYLRPVPTRLEHTYRLDFLDARAAAAAIQRPAHDAGVEFTDAAVKQLVDDLRQVHVQRLDGRLEQQLGLYVEPVQLQVVCTRLWDRLPPGTEQILPADLQLAGGDVDAALAGFYAERVAAVAGKTGVSERVIRDWFEHKLITPQGIRSQALREVGASGGLDNRAVAELENAHLVRAEQRGGAIWYELAHDRLVGPVRKDNAAWALVHLQPFQRQAAVWNTENKPESLLLRGADLEEAERWAASHAAELSEIELEYLEACRELRQREESARQLADAQQQAEIERQRAEVQRQRAEDQQRAAVQLRRRAILLALALLVALISAGAAVYNAIQAVENANLANAESTRAVANANTAQVLKGVAEANAGTADAAKLLESTQRAAAESNAGTADAAKLLESTQRAAAEANAATADAAKMLESTQRALAESNADQAVSRQVANYAFSYINPNLPLAQLLSVEAYQRADTLEARSVLLAGLLQGLKLTFRPVVPPLPPETKEVLSVAISTDGERMAWGNAIGEVVVWNYRQGKVESRFPLHQAAVWSLAFSPDGKLLASGGDDSQVVLQPIPDGEAVHLRVSKPVLSVTWNPNSRQVAAGLGSRLMIWEVGGPRDPVVDATLLYEVNAVAWSPDGSRIAVGTSLTEFYLVDPGTGEPTLAFRGHDSEVLSVAWTPDSARVAAGTAGGTVRVWDALNGELLAELPRAHREGVLSLSFSSDGGLLASSSADDRITVWDANTYQPAGSIEDHSDDVQKVAFVPRGGPRLLASASRDKSILLHEVHAEQPLGEELQRLRGRVLGLTAGADGPLKVASDPRDLQVLDLSSGQSGPVFDFFATSLATLSPDGSRVAVASESGRVQVFDPATGQELMDSINLSGAGYNLGAGGAYSVGFASDNHLAATRCREIPPQPGEAGGAECELFLVDPAGGTTSPAPLPGPIDSLIHSLAISQDGRLLATGHASGKVLLWDLDTLTQARLPLTGHNGRVTSMAFSADGGLLASGSADTTIQLWDVQSGQPVAAALFGAQDAVLSLTFSPDGKALYSGGADGALIRWDVDPDSWMKRACAMAGRNFSRAEWDQFFLASGEAYRQTCDQFPLE